MSKKFAGKWQEKEEKTPFYKKIKEAVSPSGPLKPRLNLAIKRIELQIQRLEKATENLSKRDKSLFVRIVKAYSSRDTIRANVLAGELAEIRKMEKSVMHAGLALEQIVLRLRTVSELGDVVSTLAPTVNVLRSVKTGMARILPQAGRELGQIGDLLNGIIMDASYSAKLNIDFEAANEGAQKILNEAATVAEQKIKQIFPKVPFEVSTAKEKVSAVT